MPSTPPYPSDQHNDASAIPVRIVSGNPSTYSASATNGSVQVTGTVQAMPSLTCTSVVLANGSAVSIDVVQGGSSFPLFAGSYLTLSGFADLSQLSVKRTDGDAAAVTLSYRIES